MGEKRDQYVEKMKAKLDMWNAKIEKIEAATRQAGMDSKKEYQDRIQDLQTKRAGVEQKIQDLLKAGDGAWKDLKAGVKSSLKALDKATHSAASNFK
jgi:uncharacterized coiled-coil DUF342 family protein